MLIVNKVNGKWFNINTTGVGKGCFMSSWLINLYMEKMMKGIMTGEWGSVDGE